MNLIFSNRLEACGDFCWAQLVFRTHLISDTIKSVTMSMSFVFLLLIDKCRNLGSNIPMNLICRDKRIMPTIKWFNENSQCVVHLCVTFILSVLKKRIGERLSIQEDAGKQVAEVTMDCQPEDPRKNTRRCLVENTRVENPMDQYVILDFSLYHNTH